MSFKKFAKKIIPGFLIGYYHYFLAFIAAVFYFFPSQRLKVVGVTGTNGKSTTVELIAKVLRDQGYSVAFLSSIKLKVKDRERKNMFKMTMPGRFQIQKFLKQALKEGCQYVVLEVTSEGIKQHRHCFIRFEAAVLTNLTPEHIESHGSFEKYRQAKGKLFKATKKIHIINFDDPNKNYFLQFRAQKKYDYGLKQGKINNRELDLKLKLVGDFNIYNALAAISLGFSQNISLNQAKKSVEEVAIISGRMEEVISKPFKVFVDYAVTPDSLEKLYLEIKKIFPINNIIAVFGSCGGGRDNWKRPVMGKIAAKYCDKIIITNEDPYDEDPYRILSMIKSGISNSKFPISNLWEILDRRKAIGKALELAKPGDVVLITGKGSEPWMCLANDKKIPWDDREIVKEEFNLIGGK